MLALLKVLAEILAEEMFISQKLDFGGLGTFCWAYTCPCGGGVGLLMGAWGTATEGTGAPGCGLGKG